MNDLERFKAVVHRQQPDYVPIFGFPGAPGMSNGALSQTHKHLVATGMPDWVDGSHDLGKPFSVEVWRRYWGTTGPISTDFFPGQPAKGIKMTTRTEGRWRIIESETGAVTRQTLDNDETYIMPHYMSYDVRDRASWEFYKDRVTAGPLWSADEIDAACRKFDHRDKPLGVGVGGTWGWVRSLMGPEAACTLLYDDPELAHDMLDWAGERMRTYVFPVIERLRPEIIQGWEDMCYNHGLLVSPAHFREFCAPFYREVAGMAQDCGVDVVAVDCDGDVTELVDLLAECGINGCYPFEVKAGNDLFAVRERHPEFVLFGGLEKESVNEGNEHLIEHEIRSKVPSLLAKGRYFPNLEHGMQPMATFKGLCKFMTVLMEVTNNPGGEFPRC